MVIFILLYVFYFFRIKFVNINDLDIIKFHYNIRYLIGITLAARKSTIGNILILFFYPRITNFKEIWTRALNFLDVIHRVKYGGHSVPATQITARP